MIVRLQGSKPVVDEKNVILKNYPLNWIEGLQKYSVDEISQKIFGTPYSQLMEWEFTTLEPNLSFKKQVNYKRRKYSWTHVTKSGIRSNYIDRDSHIWRGIYYPDIGAAGRFGGANEAGPGNGRHPGFLNYRDRFGKYRRDLVSPDMTSSLIDSAINLVFPSTLQVPPPLVTLDHFEKNGIKVVYSLGGPKGGQPLSRNMVGIGKTSKLGSTWYNHPNAYVNNRHAPGETFRLIEALKRGNSHPAVIAFLQQDEPVYTNIYSERYEIIKEWTSKPVFCTFNWGDFYASKSPLYQSLRKKRIRPIARVTDIYSNDLYIFRNRPKSFKNFGDPKSNIWRLIDRHRAEIEELRSELRDFDKPVWMTLQGFGIATSGKPDAPVIPDPKFMFAQIWGAICLGATGIALYLMHNASSDASNFKRRSKNPRAPLIQGISPIGPNGEAWFAMKYAYQLIEKYEHILLTETIEVPLCKDGHIVTLLKEYQGKFYIFCLNCFRDEHITSLAFNVLPGKAWEWKDLRSNMSFKLSRGVEIFRFSPFELKIIEVASA